MEIFPVGVSGSKFRHMLAHPTMVPAVLSKYRGRTNTPYWLLQSRTCFAHLLIRPLVISTRAFLIVWHVNAALIVQHLPAQTPGVDDPII